MITLDLILKNIKLLGIIALCLFVSWLWHEKEIYKSESKRQEENNQSVRRFDSLKFSYQILNERELKEHLEYENKDLLNKLKDAGIKETRIKEIISTKYKYKDTVVRKFGTGPFIDSTKCLVIKGFSDSSGVTILSKDFQNKSDKVYYWQRRQWKFLGIKTRLLGKIEMTSAGFDDCGESETVVIRKKE